MQIKLLKTVKDSPEGSIVNCDQLTAKRLFDSQEAIEYTDDLKLKEHNIAVRSLAETEKKNLKMESKTMNIIEKNGDQAIQSLKEKYPLGYNLALLREKSLKAKGIEFKSILGMNEATGADGGDLTYTAVSEIFGNAMTDSVLYKRATHLTLPERGVAYNIPLDNSDPYLAGNAPVVTVNAEGVVASPSLTPFVMQTLTPTKHMIYVPATVELLEDVPNLDAWMRTYMYGKIGNVADYKMLRGNATTDGFYGIFDASANNVSTQVAVTSAAPTVTQLNAFKATVPARYLPTAEWFMSRTMWETIAGSLASYNNLYYQLVDINSFKLLGKQVNIMNCLTAPQICFGSPESLLVAESRLGEVFKINDSIYFDTAQVAYRLYLRMSGTPTYVNRTAADSTVYSGWAHS
jgi:HK97 family phage major capsid protein